MRKTVANQVKNPRRSARSVEIPSLASGWQIFKYGKLGELTENIRTFALPFENQPYTFKMQYEYDSWNRIQKMTYPDGEEVYYEYNLGGMLEKMSGYKNGAQYIYIDSIAYNKFELKESVHHGNGTRTYYNYDVLQRLKHLHSECADGVIQDLYYDYDDVSNITSIGNHAGMLPNGLGGNYQNRYRYDNLYRLVHSDGEWAGDRYLHYNMEMSYLKNGRLRHKRIDTETWIDGTPVPVNYNNNYSYDENQQPNTVRGIYGSHHHEMQWDAKGNMVFHRNHYAGYDRRLCWDERNRLMGVKDDGSLSFYMYDDGGDRTYKLAQDLNRQNQSGRWRVYHNMLKPTLYASPYVVCSRTGYTKHYYAESERVASRIGGGGLHDLDEIVDEKMFLDHRYRANMLFHRVQECMEAAMETEESPLRHLYDWRDINEDETRCYWYHTDHLGSSSWITYTDGSAVEHLHYLPWGEDLVRQRHTNYHARYTFSGKEKDMETGYSYFGSRYYSSDLSIWLSVDPQARKYPSLSPYVYCANNPIKLVDPNGEEIASPDDPPKKNTSSNQQTSNSMLLYYKQEYKKADNFTAKLNYGLKIVGEKLNFDEQNFVDAAGSFLQGAALFNPLVGITNDIKIVSSGTDIYGNQSNIADRFVSGLDAVSFGTAKSLKHFGVTLSKGYEKTFNAINKVTTLYSAGSTIGYKKYQTKEGGDNGQKK